MNYCCDWCSEDKNSALVGVYTLHQKAPLRECIDDEVYNFCTYKCLTRWLAL